MCLLFETTLLLFVCLIATGATCPLLLVTGALLSQILVEKVLLAVVFGGALPSLPGFPLVLCIHIKTLPVCGAVGSFVCLAEGALRGSSAAPCLRAELTLYLASVLVILCTHLLARKHIVCGCDLLESLFVLR